MHCFIRLFSVCVLGLLVLSGCHSMAELERQSAIVIRLEGQEGVGGSGVRPEDGEGQEGIGGSGLNPGGPPDGIGGTGIVGLVQNDTQLSVGGVPIPSIEGASVYQDGNVLSPSAIASGQIAAVLLDSNDLVREIHVFDASDGLPGALAGVDTLILRGELARAESGTGVTLSGIVVPKAVASLARPGEIIQLEGTAVSARAFRVDRAGTVQIDRPLISQPGVVSKTPTIRPEPVDNVLDSVVVPDSPVVPVRPEQPQAVEVPTVPAPVVPQPPVVVPPVKEISQPVRPVDVQIESTQIQNSLPDAGADTSITPVDPPDPPAPSAPPKGQPDTTGVTIQTDLITPVARP